MSNYNLRVNTARTICWVTLLSDALPATAGTTLTDVLHGEAGDGVDEYAGNHVLYHDVQDALYRQLGIQDMQSISIVPSGALASEAVTSPAKSLAAAATSAIVLTYQPSAVVAANADFTFVSSVPAKATVNSAGLVTAVAAGVTVITATHKAMPNLVVTITVTVT